MDNGGMMSAAPDELRQPPSDGAIFDRIVAAVMEQKLAGGAKLPEAALCEAFDCSRIADPPRAGRAGGARRRHAASQSRRLRREAERGRSARRVRGAARDRAFDRPFGGGPHRRGRALRAARQRPRRRRRRGRGRPQRVDPAVRPVSSSPRRSRRQRRADAVPRGPRHPHLADHRPLRLAQRPLLLRVRTRRAGRRARPPRRRRRRRPSWSITSSTSKARSTFATSRKRRSTSAACSDRLEISRPALRPRPAGPGLVFRDIALQRLYATRLASGSFRRPRVALPQIFPHVLDRVAQQLRHARPRELRRPRRGSLRICPCAGAAGRPGCGPRPAS